MSYRGLFLSFVSIACLCAPLPLSAQISRDSKYDILRTVLADQAAARIGLPFGDDGVELSDSGEINKDKLDKDLKKNGQSIEAGKVVTVTEIAFDDNRIDIELDGGGKNKKGFLDRIQVGVGMGNRTTPVGRDDKTAKAKGSKIVVRFVKKVPAALTPDQLKEILNPILDFNKRNFRKTGIDALPPEFQEAVRAREARIGMDKNTVILALGRPDNKFRETRDGVYTEQWLYNLRGLRALFVTFEDNVVVQVKQY
jgi:hypothetical protein